MTPSKAHLTAQVFAGLLGGLIALGASIARADSTPELIHYKFDGAGTTVANLASSPPAGAATATIMGSLSQTGTDLNFMGIGHSLVGSGNSSSTDYLNTGWATNLSGMSWTISFVTSNIGPSSTLFYIFGDAGAGSFRCFTNGVAGSTNWIIRGSGITDTYASGAATIATHRTTFVYDMAASNIKSYVDGVLSSTVAQASAPIISGAGPFKVVGYATNVGAPAGGLLDDFRVYNRALTAAEVAAIDTHSVVNVLGNGTIIVDGDATPDPADHTDFGGVLAMSGTITRTFTIENLGNLDLAIGLVAVSGTEAADFTVSAQPGSPVAPAATTTFSVTFDPSAAGTRAAILSFTTDDPNAPTFDFAIRGVGLADAIFGDGFEG